MLGRSHNIPRLQSDFYRDQFRRVLTWLIASFAITLSLIVAIIYVLMTQPVQEYYANTTEGRIFPMPRAQQG